MRLIPTGQVSKLSVFVHNSNLTNPEFTVCAVAGLGEGLRLEVGPVDGMIASGVCDRDMFSWPIHGFKNFWRQHFNRSVAASKRCRSFHSLSRVAQGNRS